ncbi:hypothetical protein B0J11DRAFT_303936 [Dendryphion nanum]|uniref:Rhodopsin domain-containing protein n=1 Tax=Dendryphion nanum TaxID=256645 RepID=A0A9P9IM18_9PLEO|nr:hypothetical protein B0J11DRAFT_303936 [Dendryphion nanum]
MESQQPIILWLNGFLMAFTLLALCARVGRRIFVVGMFSWHDALITLAAVSAFVFSIFQIVGTTLGLGLHQRDVDPNNSIKIAKLILASNVFYFLCNWAVKHALLLFYAEITREKKFLGSIYFMHFIAFGFGSSSILANLFQCRPFNKAWRPELEGYCVNLNYFFYFNSNFMLATDLVLYIMPVVFTWHLQLRRAQRIGLNCLFALGGLVLAVSAARVYAVHMFNTQNDFSWWFSNSMIWSVLENHLAIIVACAPSVKVIALLVFPRLASSVGKVASRLTPSYSRSRSRTSSHPHFGTDDLESGTRKSDKLRITPSSTPLPSPAFTAGSGRSRASQNFAKWFKSPSSPRTLGSSGDSMEDHGLVYVEELQPTQVRVQHTITVEEASRSSKEVDVHAI